MKSHIKNLIFILISILLLFILIVLSDIVYTSFVNKLFLKKHIENIKTNNISDTFSINKIVLFSSCTSDSNINSNNTTTINNLLQFTDIAIFINNNINEFSLENTLKSVSIKDISFNTSPSIGTPNLYYKSLTDFATSNFSADNLLNSELTFKVTSEDVIDYNKPILFNNCANPITLSYINTNIVNNYTIDNSDKYISYDGSLLRKCNVLLNDINCNLSFVIYIENNLGQYFKCPVYINIPLEDSISSIYDGSYTFVYEPNSIFFKID